MEEVKVNDGGGLFDSAGLIDSLIVDCNDSVMALTRGEYIKWCNLNVQMVQKLAVLKEGIRKEMESMQKKLDDSDRLNKGVKE